MQTEEKKNKTKKTEQDTSNQGSLPPDAPVYYHFLTITVRFPAAKSGA